MTRICKKVIRKTKRRYRKNRIQNKFRVSSGKEQVVLTDLPFDMLENILKSIDTSQLIVLQREFKELESVITYILNNRKKEFVKIYNELCEKEYSFTRLTAQNELVTVKPHYYNYLRFNNDNIVINDKEILKDMWLKLIEKGGDEHLKLLEDMIIFGLINPNNYMTELNIASQRRRRKHTFDNIRKMLNKYIKKKI